MDDCAEVTNKPGSDRYRSISKRRSVFTRLAVRTDHSRCIELALILYATELEKSTEMFRQLADPNGANNSLSQVLYGLALR